MIAALFVRRNSVYKSLEQVDCWDIHRDASQYSGPYPVVCHPPCRAWGKFAHVSKHSPFERHLAILAVGFVRQFGGVLEHPVGSGLFSVLALPKPGGLPDAHGGRTMRIDQCDFGHRARKPTLLYYVGCEPPPLPPPRSPVTTVQNMCLAERERTPRYLAEWLCEFVRNSFPSTAKEPGN